MLIQYQNIANDSNFNSYESFQMATARSKSQFASKNNLNMTEKRQKHSTFENISPLQAKQKTNENHRSVEHIAYMTRERSVEKLGEAKLNKTRPIFSPAEKELLNKDFSSTQSATQLIKVQSNNNINNMTAENIRSKMSLNVQKNTYIYSKPTQHIFSKERHQSHENSKTSLQSAVMMTEQELVMESPEPTIREKLRRLSQQGIKKYQ